MENSLLSSLRSIVCNDAARKQAASPQDYSRFTDFKRLPDYAGYQAAHRMMETAFGIDADFSNFYFLPRSGSMGAEIDTPAGQKTLFSGYNYLGLSADRRVIDATKDAVETFGTHAGAARMVGGEIALHRELERALADFTGHGDAVVGVGGYGANVSVLAYLMGKRDLIVHDSYMHNSGIAGAVQSGAKRVAFAHNDLDELGRILAETRDRHERAIILVEGAYSMDGDVADLPRLVALKETYGCWLMVDEAHSIGTLGATGRGLAEHWGMDPKAIDIAMGTLSKSFASCGGFICGSEDLIALLRIYAPGLLLYSTGISPANCAASLAALEVLKAEPERVRRLQANAAAFCEEAAARGLDIGNATGAVPIVPVMVGDDMKGLRVAWNLFRNGVLAHPIIYPVVPRNASRIRFFITAMHERAHIVDALDRLQAELAA